MDYEKQIKNDLSTSTEDTRLKVNNTANSTKGYSNSSMNSGLIMDKTAKVERSNETLTAK